MCNWGAQKIRLIVPLILVFGALPAQAQEQQQEQEKGVTAIEVSLGFSYAHVRLDSETSVFQPTSRNFYGLQAGVKLNLHKNIGIMLFDMGLEWGGTKVPNPLGGQFDTNTRLETIQALFGPEFAWRGKNVELFGRTLVGLNRTALLFQFTNNSAELESRTHFAFGAGGGVDFPFRNDMAVRVGADYIPTRVNGGWENDFRNYVGIVIRTW